MSKIVAGRSVYIKLLIIFAIATAFFAVSLTGFRQRALASAFGPTPTHTNAPGEANCTACHGDFEVNSGSGGVMISGIPETYTSGQQITVTVTATQADAVIYGFQLTAIDGTGRKIGTFDVPPASDGRIQILQGVVGQNNLVREYVEHTSGGLSNGQFGFNAWVFKWTAPSTSAGRVDFYAAANCSNSDGNTSGDYIYTTAVSTMPAASTPVSIGGKVTSPTGILLRSIKVVLTKPDGTQVFANTSSFGVYSFPNVPSGASYTVTAQSKRYRFTPQIVTPNANLSNVDFVGLE